MLQSIKRGGVYLVRLGQGEGSEQSGWRPFLVLQNDMGNEHAYTHTGIPLSTELKSLYLPTHIVANDSILDYVSVILIEQMRSISRSRFVSFLGNLDANTLNKVETAVNIQLGLTDIREVHKVVFLKRLTELNPFIKIHICGRCLKALRGVKGLRIRGVHEENDKLDFCILCHKAKGRVFKVVNRERIRNREETSKRIKNKAHQGK